MKTSQGLSRPVLVFAAASLFFIVLVLWVGLRRPSVPKSSTEDTFSDTAPLEKSPALLAESNDAETPDRTILIYVQDTKARPITGAQIRATFQQSRVGGLNSGRSLASTEADGTALCNFPQRNVERLEVTVSHQDFSARKMAWDVVAGDSIPLTYTVTLADGLAIGGVVTDGNGNPIAGAQVNFGRAPSANREPRSPAERAVFPSESATTDSNGRWRAGGFSDELVEEVSLFVGHPDFTPEIVSARNSSDFGRQLRALTLRTVLKREFRISGRVTDELDNPISNAEVTAANSKATLRAKSDSDGRFHFDGLNEASGNALIGVAARNWQSQIRKVTLTTNMEEVVFKLKPGNVIRGVVQNKSGEPVSGVFVEVDAQSLKLPVYLSAVSTEKDGSFEWTGAPDEPVKFNFRKSGYVEKRGELLTPERLNVVVLEDVPKIQGWVLDAGTEKPITNFSVRVGNAGWDDSFYGGQPDQKFNDANGMFTLKPENTEYKSIKAAADGYAEKIERIPQAQDGIVEVVFRLKPSEVVRAVVMTPDGSPVGGVPIAIVKGEFNLNPALQFRGGKLDAGLFDSLFKSEANGEFTIPSPPELGALVAFDADTGFGLAAIQQVRETGRLVLQPFGRIEGILKIAGRPAAGQDILFWMANVGIGTDGENYKATTDDHGRFQIDKVPPGHGQVVRITRYESGGWTPGHRTDVVVEPGKSTWVELGDSGALLKGHVSFETPPQDAQTLSFRGILRTEFPGGFPNLQTPGQHNDFYESQEWKDWQKQARYYGVMVNSDGSLSVDSISPGTYVMDITAWETGVRSWENKRVASGSTTVSVPEGASPYSPIQLPEIILKPNIHEATSPQ